MTNTNKLRGRIVEKGFTMESLSEQIGLSRQSLSRKLHGRVEFTASEIAKLRKALDIDTDEIELYFFAEPVPDLETLNTEVQDSEI